MQSTKYGEDRQRLASKLLNCVKQCQIRYGGKTELASEKDIQVAELCSSLETVLSHGLRSTPITSQLTTSTLKQVSKLIAGRLHLTDDTPVFWHYVLLFLTPHERERYAVLKNINTDIGRGRAWIRGSLNERTLERYFHYMLESTELLYAHYEDWALMRDSERSCMFTNMIAGLNSILFAININNMELNSSDIENNKTFLKNMKNEPIIVTQIIPNDNNDKKIDRKQKNRKVAKQIITFDDDDDNQTNPFLINDNETVQTNSSDDIKSISTNSSIDSSFSPPGNTSILDSHHNGVQSSSASSAGGIHDDSIEAVEFVENEETPAAISIIVPTNEFCDISHEELMTPMDTSTHFIDEIETSSSDRSSVDSLTRNYESLKKENETLKSQLKKYIGAVQMLHKHPDEANLTLMSSTTSKNENKSSKTSKFDEAKHYEAKLIQVAEMHAELMEFNEYLQQQINFKDAVIQRLKKQLNQNITSSMASSSSSNDYAYDNNTHLRGEVFISIPSAFLSSGGTSVSSESRTNNSSSSGSHHVYQIHIRAGNHEWNIFRRYAHFHALHSQLKKLDPTVAKFKFPPKKTIGNKDAALVEKRRKLLEQYLRKLFDHWPELGACSSRAALEQYLAFFREPAKFEEETKWNNTLRQTLFPSFGTGDSSSNSDIHYNGL